MADRSTELTAEASAAQIHRAQKIPGKVNLPPGIFQEVPFTNRGAEVKTIQASLGWLSRRRYELGNPSKATVRLEQDL